VLSIALLRQLFDFIYRDQARDGEKERDRKRDPHEVFDLICGTSTGGIIAALLSLFSLSLSDSERLYDTCIERIFANKSRLKFVRHTAFYDERVLEELLGEICGEDWLIDGFERVKKRESEREVDRERERERERDSVMPPMFFCVSSMMHTTPPQIQIWRNYEYPPPSLLSSLSPSLSLSHSPHVYAGSSCVEIKTAIRATTAAPTFFTPVHWQDGLYCDGALVANNPTAIAIQEAKRLFPGVPIDCVVSVGTGWYVEERGRKSLREREKETGTENETEIERGGDMKKLKVGLDLLLNQLIGSSTDTEDVHHMLQSLLPANQYFRFNPLMRTNMAIDEKDPKVLLGLKSFAKEAFDEMLEKDGEHVQELVRKLRDEENGLE
jgi:predicted acylesterase/phospholipase RssA